MLSRVAESVYWMSRYIERAENVARFIDVNAHLMLDFNVVTEEQWMPLVTITGDERAFLSRYREASQESVIQFLAFDRDNPNSILSSLRMARENARAVRPRITTEMWEHINQLYLVARDAVNSNYAREIPHEFFNRIKLGGQKFVGLTDVTMSHGEAWHFCRLGRTLERADKTSRLLDVKYFILLPSVEHVGMSVDDIQWAALLRSASAFEMYRQHYGTILPRDIVEFLLLNQEFPRALHYCLIKAEESLHGITGTREHQFRNLAEQRLGQLRSDFAYTGVDDIIRHGLHEFLDQFQDRLNAVGDAIYETFFALRTPGGS